MLYQMNIRFFIMTVFVMLVMHTTFAQPGELPKEARERIESQRVAFITQQLRLTPEEAEKFWPIYNEYRDAIKDMREDFERPDLEAITEEEAAKIIEQHLQQEQKKLDLKRNLVTRLRNVVSSKKILKLQKAEMEFNRELLRRMQEHRKQ